MGYLKNVWFHKAMTKNQPNKIILTIFSLQGGGAERFVLTLAEGFKTLGYDPHIICFKNQIDYPKPDVALHFLSYQSYRWMPKTIRNRVFARVFDKYVKDNISDSPALIISNLWQVDQVLAYSQLENKVFVIHNTLSKEKQVHTYLTDKALNDAYKDQHIVAVSKGVEEDFIKIVTGHESIADIHNPIDRDSIILEAKNTQVLNHLMEKYPVLKKGYIVHVGKFKTQKNHEGLLLAYADSKQSLPLLLVGQGNLKDQCMNLCEELGIKDKVVFAGFLSNPYPVIANAKGMVLSSIYEGFGLVIAEALALGVPVISTDCESGPRELLPSSNLVPVGDNIALANKLNSFMQNPDKFKSNFDISLLPQSVAQKYLSINLNY